MGIIRAQWRKHKWYSKDPFYGKICPALLNSVDIKRYVDEGCLVERRDFKSKKLKTASYEMDFLGEVYDWVSWGGEKQRRRRRVIKKDCNFKLEQNSISYLWIKEKLLLPEYIAARFNLHIRHVHKGLLLGTGPLVDPGFSGRLLVPLHNLTDNDYEIEGGDGIIWVEFTKLSENRFWKGDGEIRPKNLQEFPNIKDLDDPLKYIDKAMVTEVGGVQSAFKGELDRARMDAYSAREEVEKIKRMGIVAIAIGFLGIAASVAALWKTGNSLILQAVNLVQESESEVLRERLEGISGRIGRLEGRLDGADSRALIGENDGDSPAGAEFPVKEGN